ncbi:MAG: thiamine phosphate synthase [Candidatus Omnitrophota bacterium]
MTQKNKIYGYYFITDQGLSRAGIVSDVKSALRAGVSVVQYRNKCGTTRQQYDEARKLRVLCKKAGALFLINDRVDVALAVDADGVHFGNDDMAYEVARKLLGTRKIIGLTVHSVKEARSAQRAGADYLGLSPIFATATKIDAGKPAGVSLIKEVRAVVSLPIVAIGGITLENAPAAVTAGADALCAISAVITKKNAENEIRKFQKIFQFSS